MTMNSSDLESRIQATRQFYNDNVQAYVANINEAGITHVPLEHLESFVRRLRAPAKMLELGCGDGRDARRFSEMGVNVIGVDYARAMVATAQENAQGVHFLVMDMRQIGRHFLTNSLDGIWACATVIHLPKRDIPALFDSMFDILRPGGVLYLSVKEGIGESFDPDERYAGVRKFYAFYQEDELLDYLKTAGFVIEKHGKSDHRKEDLYATNPFIHVFAAKPER